jgi:hypothetical protein
MKPISRRKALRTVAITVGGLAACVAVVRGSGYPARAGVSVLADADVATLEAFARRVCAGDVPSVPSIEDTKVIAFVDAQMRAMDAPLQRDLRRCLLYLEQLAPLRSGFSSRFSKLGPDQQDAVLRAMECSAQGLFRGAFQSIKALVLMGYYRDDRTFSILAYEGPMVKLE